MSVGEGGEGGEGGNAVPTGMEGGMEGMESSSPSTPPQRPRTSRAGACGVGRGSGRGRGTGGGVGGRLPSVAERYDQADEDHDCGAEGVDMRVEVADSAKVLRALSVIDSGETNLALNRLRLEVCGRRRGREVAKSYLLGWIAIFKVEAFIGNYL